MESKERYLWLFHSRLDGTNRVWWAYFPHWAAVHACLAEIAVAFPDFALQKLEVCQDGLKVLDYAFAATCSEQDRADAEAQEKVGERDKRFFPLAPSACDYLTSFRASLGGSARERGV